MEDPIVEEVRRIREEHAAAFGYDIDAIVADYKRMADASNRPRVSLAPRRIPSSSEQGGQRPKAVAK